MHMHMYAENGGRHTNMVYIHVYMLRIYTYRYMHMRMLVSCHSLHCKNKRYCNELDNLAIIPGRLNISACSNCVSPQCFTGKMHTFCLHFADLGIKTVWYANAHRVPDSSLKHS